MAITYPLLHPSAPGFRSISIRPKDAVQVAASPFTGQQQVQAHQAQFWQADVQLPPMRQADGYGDEWTAWLTALRGQYGTFMLGDSSHKLPRGTQALIEYSGRATRLGPIVSGASQTGNVLVTSRWATSSQCFNAGDYIQVGSQNLLLRSQAFDHAAWSKSNVTVTADNTAGPEGHDPTGAERIVVGGSGDAYIEQQFIPSSNGDVHTFSVWLKTGSGTATISIGLQSESGAYATLACAVTTAWTRFSVSGKASSATSNPVAILGRTTGLPNGVTFYAWGAQVNLGSDADQYMPTTSAAVSKTLRLYKVMSDAYSNGSGVCSVNIWPRLRESPADGEFIKVHNCKGTFRLASEPVWSVGPDKIYDVGFSAVEAI